MEMHAICLPLSFNLYSSSLTINIQRVLRYRDVEGVERQSVT